MTTLLSDASHFEGSLTVARGDGVARLADDPFARIFPARLLHVGAGVVGRGARAGRAGDRALRQRAAVAAGPLRRRAMSATERDVSRGPTSVPPAGIGMT